MSNLWKNAATAVAATIMCASAGALATGGGAQVGTAGEGDWPVPPHVVGGQG
jgi:hypothetical protein